MSELQTYIDQLTSTKSLTIDESYQAFSIIADGKSEIREIKKFLLEVNEKGIDENLLFGAAKSLNERSIKLKAPKNSVDVCGTGGDNSNSLNISTSCAIILASMGVTIAKHGNKAVSSKSGSADIFKEIGIDIMQEKNKVEESLEKNNLAFIFAPLYHPALKNVAQARQELGIRTIFNFLGPLLNPANTQNQLIGCSDQKMAKIMLKACHLMGKNNCWVVTGLDGMDEISISDNSKIYKMQNNKHFTEETFNPEDFGIKKRNINLIKGKDPKYNSEQLIKLLKGKIDNERLEAYFDIVCLNCACALVISSKFNDFNIALNAVQNHIKNGNSYEFLIKFIKDIGTKT